MKTKHVLLPFILAIFVFINACEKDDPVDPTPVANFTASKTTAAVDEVIQFTNTSTDATSFAWSFGDGSTSTLSAPTKSYATSAVFTVTLSATGPGGMVTTSKDITIIPVSSFTVADEANLNNTTPVQFTNTSKGATSYVWTFGDAGSSSSTQADPSFTYTVPGTYTVTLVATGAGGAATSSKSITVSGVVDSRELFFIEYGNSLIKKLALDGSGNTTDVLDIAGKGGVGLAFDAANGKIYFSDFEVVPEGKIWRMNLDGSGLEAIVTGLDDPYAIALDLGAGKIYWVDNAGNVSRANLDGTSQEIGIVNIVDGGMRAIALDLENDKMYFYEVNFENLFMANLDGSNVVSIVDSVYGYTILVDSVNDKIYFDEQNSATLIRANLDGSNQQTVDAEGSRIYGSTIDYTENKLYWSRRDAGEILRANLDGTSPELLKSGLSSPRGIFIKE